MKRTIKRELNLNEASPIEYNLNKLSTGCAPCLNEALKIDRQINGRKLILFNVIKFLFLADEKD